MDMDMDMDMNDDFPKTPLFFIPATPFNPRRLSASFSKPTTPISKPPFAWISLQGRLIAAHEATSATTIGGCLTKKEAVAWDLFTPIHRLLIVAVVAVAAAKSDKNRQIRHLQNCVQLRDQILMSMQQKLDNLCDQMNCIKDQPQAESDPSPPNLVANSHSICTHCWL